MLRSGVFCLTGALWRTAGALCLTGAVLRTAGALVLAGCVFTVFARLLLLSKLRVAAPLLLTVALLVFFAGVVTVLLPADFDLVSIVRVVLPKLFLLLLVGLISRVPVFFTAVRLLFTAFSLELFTAPRLPLRVA